MPIIYTYPTILPASNDLVLLTDKSDSQKATKTATVSSLLSLGLAQDINTTKISLSTAQVRFMDTSPIDAIPAPGPGKFIAILNAHVYFTYTAPGFNSAAVLLIYSTLNPAPGAGTQYPSWETVRFMNTTTSGGRQMAKSSLVSNPQWVINDKIIITSEHLAWPGYTGNGTIDVYITYKIIDI